MPFTLDTHAAVRHLEAAGIVPEQAEAIVETIRRSDSDLATKADVAEVRTELKAEIGEVRTEIKAEIAEVRTELKAEIAEVRADVARHRTETKAEIAEVRADVARQRAETKAEIAEIRTRIERAFNRVLFAIVALVGLVLAVEQFLG